MKTTSFFPAAQTADPLVLLLLAEGSVDEADELESSYEAGAHVTRQERERIEPIINSHLCELNFD